MNEVKIGIGINPDAPFFGINLPTSAPIPPWIRDRDKSAYIRDQVAVCRADDGTRSGNFSRKLITRRSRTPSNRINVLRMSNDWTPSVCGGVSVCISVCLSHLLTCLSVSISLYLCHSRLFLFFMRLYESACLLACVLAI